MLLALTFVTGIIDAVSFLGLGQVFAAMQTGNVIFLGFGIAGTAGSPVTDPIIGLTAFIAGSGIAAVALSHSRRRGPHLGPAMAIEVLLLGGVAIATAISEPSRGTLFAFSLIAVLSLAMGLRNTLARQLGGTTLATTVLNLTLTAVSSPSSVSIATGSDLAVRGSALLAILAGALTGALLLKVSLSLPLAIAAAITLTTLFIHASPAFGDAANHSRSQPK
jgi:uncharacterized membrane protein YoaK (UPF0700 family)